MILNGWISLDGKVYECFRMDHKNKAYEIGKICGFDVDYNDEYGCMWDHGFIRFSGDIDNNNDPFISFDDQHYSHISHKNPGITEAQKMAQAKLLKMIHNYKKKGLKQED